MSRHRRASFLVSLGLLALLLGALPLAAPAATRARSAPPADLPGLAIPKTPAGEQLAWALAQVNTGADGLTEWEVADRFTPDFLAALPPAGLIGIFRDYLALHAPMSVARFEGGVTETRANALLLAASGQPWRVTLGVERQAPHRINDLFFEPVALPATMPNAPATWRALDRQLRRVAPRVGFVAAEVTEGTCRPVHERNPDQTLAVGSAFKLYVLGELARQVAAGAASWDEPLTLRASLKSLPSGNLLYEPEGAVFSLRSYAERMIAESDNTATDHLIDRLGRRNVEAMMAHMGHHDPSLNTPLLMTREWFAIKLRFTPAQVEAYLKASEHRQRRILERQVAPLADTLWDGEEWSGPYLIDTIEWFASAADLCRAVAALHALGNRPGLGPVHDALSLEPGILFDPRTWRYVGYKGGYETGVKSETWLLQRHDGRWFALVAIINDPRREIDGHTLRQLLIPAAALLAETA